MFNTYLPGTDDHALVKKVLEEERQKNPNGFNYAAVVAHYNSLPADAIFTLPLKPDKKAYLVGRMTAAGLQLDLDYIVSATEVEGEDGEPNRKELVITKVTKTLGHSLGLGARKRSPEAIAQAVETRKANAAAKSQVEEVAAKVVGVATPKKPKPVKDKAKTSLPRAAAQKAAPSRKKPPKK